MKKIKCLIVLIILIVLSACSSMPKGYKTYNSNKNFYKKYDEFNKTSMYYHKDVFGKYTPINLKISDDNEISLILDTHYNGASWIFYDSVEIIDSKDDKLILSTNVDVKTGEINIKETDVSNGLVNEYSSHILSIEKIELLRKILKDDTIKMRLSGKAYKDFTLSKNTIETLRETLELYDKLNKEKAVK